MRERYETLKLADLRALAKIRGIKAVTSLKKPEIIDGMVALDEKEAKNNTAQKPQEAQKTVGRESGTNTSPKDEAVSKTIFPSGDFAA